MTGTWLLNSFSTPKRDTECCQKGNVLRTVSEGKEASTLEISVVFGALKYCYVHEGNCWFVLQEKCKSETKQNQKHPTCILQMTFKTPIMLVVWWTGRVGSNVRSQCIWKIWVKNVCKHRSSVQLLTLRFQSFRGNLKFSKENLYHYFALLLQFSGCVCSGFV